jgi:hypothetical protein
MKLIWHDYLVYSLSNCAMKLYIETGLIEKRKEVYMIGFTCMDEL